MSTNHRGRGRGRGRRDFRGNRQGSCPSALKEESMEELFSMFDKDPSKAHQTINKLNKKEEEARRLAKGYNAKSNGKNQYLPKNLDQTNTMKNDGKKAYPGMAAPLPPMPDSMLPDYGMNGTQYVAPSNPWEVQMLAIEEKRNMGTKYGIAVDIPTMQNQPQYPIPQHLMAPGNFGPNGPIMPDAYAPPLAYPVMGSSYAPQMPGYPCPPPPMQNPIPLARNQNYPQYGISVDFPGSPQYHPGPPPTRQYAPKQKYSNTGTLQIGRNDKYDPYVPSRNIGIDRPKHESISIEIPNKPN